MAPRAREWRRQRTRNFERDVERSMLNLLDGTVEEAFAAYDAESEGRSG